LEPWRRTSASYGTITDIKKVALVTDAALGNIGERLASHFVAATIRHFPAGQTEAARQWIVNPAARS
jgi:hypothetical protein